MTTADQVLTNVLPHRAGNEPDLLAVYLFNYVGRADLTQKVILILLIVLSLIIIFSTVFKMAGGREVHHSSFRNTRE